MKPITVLEVKHMASKKDYNKMAMDIKNAYIRFDAEQRFFALICDIIDQFQSDNPRFDKERFIQAIGFDPYIQFKPLP